MSQKRVVELIKLIPPKSGQNGYDAKKAEDEKRTKRNNKEVNEKEWNVPEEYLEIPLDKEKKEALIQKMNSKEMDKLEKS